MSRLSADHERKLGPYLIALFIDAGFIDLWPFEWTPKGMNARKETLLNG